MVVLSTFPPPSEGVRHQQNNTTVLMNEKSLGKGTLYIAESRVSWVSASSGEGFSLEYPHICLHAVSRTPVECLYMMVDADISSKLGEDVNEVNDEEEEESDDENDNTVMKFLPDDTTALDAMYEAMSQCQALNPDPQESDSDPENIFVDADGDGDEGENGGNNQEEEDDDGENYEEAHNGQAHDDGAAMEVDAAQFEDADSDVDN